MAAHVGYVLTDWRRLAKNWNNEEKVSLYQLVVLDIVCCSLHAPCQTHVRQNVTHTTLECFNPLLLCHYTSSFTLQAHQKQKQRKTPTVKENFTSRSSVSRNPSRCMRSFNNTTTVDAVTQRSTIAIQKNRSGSILNISPITRTKTIKERKQNQFRSPMRRRTHPAKYTEQQLLIRLCAYTFIQTFLNSQCCVCRLNKHTQQNEYNTLCHSLAMILATKRNK